MASLSTVSTGTLIGGRGGTILATGGTAVSDGSSEDCLTLNVWAPEAKVEKAPVMVWIHGGGFATGSGSEAMYNGTRLAQKAGAIVVSFNYRLGPLGFVPLPTKWTIDFAEPIDVAGYGPEGAEDPILVNRLSEQVRRQIQTIIDGRLARRRSIWFG